MTTAERQVFRTERRTARPFEATDNAQNSLERTRLMIGERALDNGMTDTVEIGEVADGASLKIVIDRAAIQALCKEWGIKVADISVVWMVEARVLNLLHHQIAPVNWSSRDDAHDTIAVAFPDWALEAMGRARLGVRLYVVLNRDRKTAPAGQPTAKGSVIASWSVSIDQPAPTHWFTPRALTNEQRELLQSQSQTRISPSTQIYIRVENLLQPGPISDAVTVYLDPEIARLLDLVRVSPAVKMLESRIAYDVLERILDSIHEELNDVSPSDLTAVAAWPFLRLLAEQVGIEPAEVLERIQTRNTSEMEALRSHLQKLANLLGTSKNVLTGANE